LIVTKQDKIPIAAKMTRIVEGGRGAYIEIHRDDIIKDNVFIPKDQEWRTKPPWLTKVYYIWYTTQDGAKLYLQQKLVGYADYLIGMWYVSPDLVEEASDDERGPQHE
jgi:hypothetical protein